MGAGECGAGEPGRVKGETPGERLRTKEWAELAQQVIDHMAPGMIDARNHKCMTPLMASSAHGFRRETSLRTYTLTYVLSVPTYDRTYVRTLRTYLRTYVRKRQDRQTTVHTYARTYVLTYMMRRHTYVCT